MGRKFWTIAICCPLGKLDWLLSGGIRYLLGHVGIAVKPIEKLTRKACLSFTNSEILRIDFLLAAAHTHKHRYHPVLKIKIHIVLIYTEDYLWMYPANIYIYIYTIKYYPSTACCNVGCVSQAAHYYPPNQKNPSFSTKRLTWQLYLWPFFGTKRPFQWFCLET